MAEIYEWFQIETDYVAIKFRSLVQVSSLINSNFSLFDATSATPGLSGISNPFQSIVVNRDYSSVSRVLYLYWQTDISLTSGYEYIIRLSNIKGLGGETLPTTDLSFEVDLQGATPEFGIPDIPTRQPVEVEDYSIKDISQFIDIIPDGATGNRLMVVEIKPDVSLSYYLNPEYNEGRIEITFSEAIAANYLSRQYFRVQRKAIGRGISRWEDVNTVVAGNSALKIVFVYLPSNDATPVYAEPDREYWEDGYKYRLRLSGDIGAEDGGL